MISKGFQGINSISTNSGTFIGYMLQQDNQMKREVNKAEFTKELEQCVGLTLVQFKADWKPACQIVSMIFDELAKSYMETVSFFTVNTDEESSVGEQYGVYETPTILFFRRGKIIDHTTGLVPKNILINKIENALTTADR
jgi:thioredoxin-like negative regulator of GroEL